MNPVLRFGVWIAFGCLFGAIPKVHAADEESQERPALVDYFPPAEDQGGWRSLLPENGDPDPKQRAVIREVAGVDWDKLQAGWRYNEAAQVWTWCLSGLDAAISILRILSPSS
jgi:hypothetical protein